MRTILVYILAFGALATGASLGFPQLFGSGAAESAASEGSASAPPPVVVAPAVRATFGDTLAALGTVLANESVAITSNRADHVAAIHFEDGQEVEAGQLLLDMNADEEKALLNEAKAIRDERRVTYDRIKELFDEKVSSGREMDEANAQVAAAEARVISLAAAIADREVRAPFKGTLGLRRVSVGAYLPPGTVITTLDDLSVVKLDFTIPETWLAAVGAGMTIAARSDAWPDDAFPGRIAMVDTRLEPRTRSATVRALLPNPERKLRPGMLLKVIVDRGEAPVLQVPEEALIPLGDEQFVFLVDGEGFARRQKVQIGRRQVGVVEVVSGLDEGDLVVIEGIVRVRPDAKVDVVAQREPKS